MENEEQQQSNPIADFFKSLFSGSGGQGSAANVNNSGTNEANDGDADVGFMNSLMMGLGLRDRTDDYYRATMDSIRRSQGQQAAQRYRDGINNQGVLSVPGALGNYNMATGAVTGMPPPPGGNVRPPLRPPQGIMSLPTAQDQLLNIQRQNMMMQTGGPGQIYPLV
tara:strand:- start:8 stop:505 length:498 start_codon:yes stop_codon:yes gene_type:complete